MQTSAHKGLAVTAEKCRTQADTIDALVAALEEAREYIDPDDYLTGIFERIDAALALARGGK